MRRSLRFTFVLGPNRSRVLGSLDRLELRQHLLCAVFPPRRQMQLRSQMRLVLVAEKSAVLAASALHQDSSGRPDVHRIEVVAILDIGSIGVAELLVDG